MKLKLAENSNLTLSPDLNIEQRLCLADEVISDNPECFSITGNTDNDRRANIRLDILGTYILNADKEERKAVMSRYKQKARRFQEIPISCFTEYSSEMILSTVC